MAYIITRKYCSNCSKEISVGKKEIAMMKDRYVIERELCVYCMSNQEFKKR